ncbi:MAG: helix-turn-helix domain-containing protein [Candidatus Contendobacter sp.]|jgi:DNA-binding transcriptional regulator YdaS (Cro superfamily)|nr:helix-turn-helix domain-containing protein [Candidatus Contendobacter sp.]
METIKRAIEILGGAKALADQVGVSQQAVHLWKSGNTQLLARHAAAIERATGGRVTAREIGVECAEMLQRAA